MLPSKQDLQRRLDSFRAKNADAVDRSMRSVKVISGGAIAGIADAKGPTVMGVEAHVASTLLAVGVALGSGNKTLLSISEGMAAYTIGKAVKEQLSS